jgi:hypothetical protein
LKNEISIIQIENDEDYDDKYKKFKDCWRNYQR